MSMGPVEIDVAQRVWLFSGKLHPAVVHFPIALLIVGVALEFFRVRRDGFKPSASARACLLLGAFSAVVAAAMGWSDASTAGHQGLVIQSHRWLGIAASVFAMLTAACVTVSTRRGTYRAFNAYRVSAVFAAGLVALTGHLGGVLIYGPGYVDDALALLRPGMEVQGTRAVASVLVGPASHHADAGVDFLRDVRPIFARRCLSCHSGSEPTSGLSLDDRENLLRGGDSGEPALLAGNAAGSRLVRLITGQEEGLDMPPKGGALDAEQVAVISRWIDQGAPWAGGSAAGEHWHWAYRPPVRPTLPAVKDTYWPRSPIDYFLLARLEDRSMAPAAEADRDTLLRRLSLDLIGLPPTLEELDAFEADSGQDAYERAVDRLLSSPHYGERWAQVWLDLARYADTHGYEKDDRRVMWPYRDWTIHALNRDLPFDRFTVDQLAGDLLPNPTLDQLVATGFHRNTMINEEGGVDAEEFRVDAVVDRVNTTASVWLGTTMGCSQCHDHKFDPFSQRDYFKFFAFLNQDQADSVLISNIESRAGGATVAVPMRENMAEFERLLKSASAAEADVRRASLGFAPDQEEWERKAASSVDSPWEALFPSAVIATDGVALETSPDGSIVARGPNPERSTYTIEVRSPVVTSLAGFKLTVLPEPGASSRGVGRAGNGNFVLTEIGAEIVSQDARVRVVPFVEAGADYEQKGGGEVWAARDAIDGNESGGGWAIGGDTGRAHIAVFRFREPVGIPAGHALRLRLVQNYGGQHTIGRLLISVPVADGPLHLPLPGEIKELLNIATERRTEEQRRELADHYSRVSPRLRPLRDRVDMLHREIEAMTVARAMIMRSLPGGRVTRVFDRGSFLNPGEAVVAAVPAALSASAGEAPSADRLGLARWIVDPKNPLTARVHVNRLWSRLFGKGLVETEEDFGTQGDPPSHAELLDWLATEFVRNGWSQKALLRTIVTSAAYRQSSHITHKGLEQDPRNRLLSRAPRFRVDAETIRDISLHAGGLLASKLGGPSVFPPQPPGVWTMIYSNDAWVESNDEDRFRRGLYTFARRTAPYPMFAGFDAPSHEIVCTRRARTNTPLQALSTLNDTPFVEASRALATRMMDGADARPDSIAALGFRLCTGRKPSGSETARLVLLFHQQVSAFTEDRPAAIELTKSDHPRTIELAAWQVVANVLLNLDETLTKG